MLNILFIWDAAQRNEITREEAEKQLRMVRVRSPRVYAYLDQLFPVTA